MTLPLNTVVHGDCIEVMESWPAESLDAIVTDPPYGLEFMGKEWDALGRKSGSEWSPKWSTGKDWRGVERQRPGRLYNRSSHETCQLCRKQKHQHNDEKCPEPQYVREWHKPRQMQAMQQWHQQWAEAAYRVAKPSAYLLAFGGTRTFHRLACALEDAGWIIRDTLVWAYLQGFPKSRASLKPSWEPIVLARKPGPLRDLDIDGCRMVGGPTAIMGPWENDANLCASCAADADYPERSGAPATRASTTPRLAAPQPSEPATSGATDRTDTGCSDGTTAASTATSSSIARSGRTRTGRSQRAGSSTISMGIVEITGSTTCPSCGSISTPTTTIDGTTSIPSELPVGTTSADIALGRWPPNVLWTDDIVGYPGVIGGGPETSRVFLIPKADRADREPVLGGLPERNAGSTNWRFLNDGEYDDFVYPPPDGIGAWLREQREAAGLKQKDVAAHFLSKTGGLTGAVANWELEFNRPTPDQWRTLRQVIGFDDRYDEVMTATKTVKFAPPERPTNQRQNHHPTVKPTDLMRHLVRLVTPAGGVVLDPFLGSGTTAIAAEMEGFAWVGIEREAEYVAIAEARLNGVQKGLGLDVPAPVTQRTTTRDSYDGRRHPGRHWTAWREEGEEGA